MMSKCILFLSSFLCIFTLPAQQSKLTNHFDRYLSKGYYYHDQRKLDSCHYFLKKVDSLVRLAPKDSVQYYRKELLEASLFVRENKAGDAIAKLLKAQLFFTNQKDSTNLGITLYTLGVANYYVNRRLVAEKYFKKARNYENYLSKLLATKIHQNLGSIHLEEGMKHKSDTLIFKAIQNYKTVIPIYQQENWKIEEALATSLLAECYNQLQDYDQALLIIEQAILISREAKNESKEGFALIKKTSILGNKKRFQEALSTIQKAIPIFQKLKDYLTLVYALNEQKKILIGLGQYKLATQVGDSIYIKSIQAYNQRFADKVSEMDAKYKTAEKEKKIAKQKEELLAKELAIKNRNLYTILLSAGLVIVGIISLGYYQKSQFKRKQLQKELDLKDALATISTQNRLQEQRLRISKDLHDNIGSQLTFIVSSLDNLKYVSKDLNQIFKDKLSNISDFTTDTIFQLRDTIWAMNKNEITFEDLSARILSFIEKAKSATNNTIAFKVRSNSHTEITFTAVQGIHLFRVIQEAINNAIKYANGDTIHVNAIEKNRKLHLTIKDNGQGFDLNEVKLGNGLSNMEERMSAIGGTIYINSKINIGTTVKIEIDLENTTNGV